MVKLKIRIIFHVSKTVSISQPWLNKTDHNWHIISRGDSNLTFYFKSLAESDVSPWHKALDRKISSKIETVIMIGARTNSALA